MSAPTIQEIGLAAPGEVQVAAIDFTDRLDSDETLSGTPTAVVSQVSGATDADGISTSSVAANTGIAEIDGEDVAIGKAVMFTVTCASDAASGSTYQILVTASTTEGQTLKERVRVRVL
jgi:hypothetical protein